MRKSSEMKYVTAKVMENTHLKGDYHILKIGTEQAMHPLPGQFFQVKPVSVGLTRPYTGSLLFKPLSIYDTAANQLHFMVKVAGEGTKQITRMMRNDKVKLIGPLGNSFDVENDGYHLLVSGGIGYAPLHLLKKELSKRGGKVIHLHGGRTAADVFEADLICTDDGSTGEKGYVTKCIPAFLEKAAAEIPAKIYSCGPKEMMRKVWEYAAKYKVPAQFSLEEYMACGIGVCQGCAVKVRQDEADMPQYKHVCKDGPVFDGKEIEWNE